MATGDEALVDQLNLTIEEEEEPPVDQPEAAPTDHDRKAVFKRGLFISLISIGGILNPPLISTATATHADKIHRLLLSKMFHVLVCVNLAIGVLLTLLSAIILHLIPRLIIVAKPLTDIGWALATITLGYGSSLALMASSSPWFSFNLIFLAIQFM